MPRKRRVAVSMEDVARLAGVSVATVSHVVNKTRPVSASTERGVLEAIATTGYVPDSGGGNSHPTTSRILGMALSSISNTYFGDMVRGVERAAAQQGLSLLLVDTHDDVASELRAVSTLLSHRVDAIILAPSADPTIAIRQAAHRNVPVVLIDRLVNVDLDRVGAENTEATAQLVDEMVAHGHSRIAMISGHPGLTTSEERVQGYLEGLHRNGIPIEPDYLENGDSLADGAHAAFCKLISLPTPPTALIVGNNDMTIGALRGARDTGLAVPQDIALVAFDDFEWADLFHPRLTVMAQPLQAMAEQAVQLVLSRLADPTLPARKVMIKPTFMHRESCGCTMSNGQMAH